MTSSSTDATVFTFAVVGSSTYRHKDALKALGGRFSKSIGNVGPGWLFTDKKRHDVQHLIERAGEVENNDDAESHGSAISDRSIMTDKEFEKAVMIEDLLHKTAITTIRSKVVKGDAVTYDLVDGAIVEVRIGDVCFAEWQGTGQIAIMKKNVKETKDFKLLPFLGTINEKHSNEGYAKVMENFICFLTLTMVKPTVYYTDGYCSYAFCDQESFQRTIDLLGLEIDDS